MAKDDKLTRDERPTTKEEKLKALDAAISHIEKQYGKGSVMKLGDNSAHMNVEAVPTGSLSLDLALGIGGLPKGRIIEIYGPESRVRRRLHCMRWQRYRREAASPDLLMRSMRLIRSMRRISVSTSTTSTYHSRTAGSRRLRSQRRWCVPEQSIL